MEFAVGDARDGRFSVADSAGGFKWVDHIGVGEAKGDGVELVNS